MATISMNPATRRPGHLTLRTRYVSVRVNYRVLLFTALTLGVLFLLIVWATTLGSFRIPFDEVVRAVWGTGTDDQLFVVRTLRLPRVIAAVLIGASLGLSGAIFQGLVRNPLVSPDIIGIETGASLVAVFWIIYGKKYEYLPIAAFAGAIITAGLIYVLAWKGGINPDRLILVGIGVGASVSAMTTFMVVRNPVEIVRAAEVWTIGSVYGSDWGDIRVLAISFAILMPLAIILTWPLRAMQLGDDVTRGLGLQLERTRLLLLLVGCGLAAISVAVAGPIGFVALMVPHMARMMAGPLSGSVMVFTAAVGAVFLLLADVVAQHFLPVSMPVGVVTAAVGAPYFLFLLYRSNLRM
jgi:iron complex transport system permease protein